MRKLLLGSVCSLMLFSFEVKAECTAAPECASLGYTKTASDCPKGALKCPYGDSYFCEEVNCKIGDIYYSDNTCNSEVISGKTALGVVVYVNPNGVGGQAISAWPVDKEGNKSSNLAGMVWSTSRVDISSLKNNYAYSWASQDFDSCGNTDKITAASDATMYPAGWAAKRFAPTNATKDKWCLPAAGILNSIYANLDVIQRGISKLGGIPIKECCLWSSTEHDYHYAIYSYFRSDSEYGFTSYDKLNSHQVRPVIKF